MPATDNRAQPSTVEPTASTADRAALGLAAVALFVAALNLRPAIAAVSPLVNDIRSDLDLSATGVSLLTTIPTLAFGIFAPMAAIVGRRWGLQRGVLLGLAVITVGTLARMGGESTWLQLSCASVAGAGIAIAQTLLPAVVKARFADRPGLVTGIYTAGLGLGGAVAAGVSAPLADAIASWPAALASWALLSLAGAVMWSASRRTLDLDRTAGPKALATRGLPWTSGTAWIITAVSAGNSALYYCELAWVAPLLQDDGGFDAPRAGVLLTTLISLQVVAMLAVPALLGERRDRRGGLAVTTIMTAVGFLGFAFSAADATWVWIIFLGMGHGGLFPLVLTLPVVSSQDPGQASRVSAMAFFVGYACAAVGPLFVGALRDVTGDFQLAFAILGGLTLLMTLPIARLSPRRLGGDTGGDYGHLSAELIGKGE